MRRERDLDGSDFRQIARRADEEVALVEAALLQRPRQDLEALLRTRRQDEAARVGVEPVTEAGLARREAELCDLRVARHEGVGETAALAWSERRRRLARRLVEDDDVGRLEE